MSTTEGTQASAPPGQRRLVRTTDDQGQADRDQRHRRRHVPPGVEDAGDVEEGDDAGEDQQDAHGEAPEDRRWLWRLGHRRGEEGGRRRCRRLAPA